jgi:hypothetical protein
VRRYETYITGAVDGGAAEVEQVSPDLSDLEAAMARLTAHGNELGMARAEAANTFAAAHLGVRGDFCYWHELLTRYAQLWGDTPDTIRVHKDAVELTLYP